MSHQSEDYNSKNKIYTDILANIIGGSMSSRLFQEIREKNGLAYSVYTYNQYYLSGGLTSTYIGTNLENYEKAIEITLSEFKKLRENGVTEDELQKAKNKYMSRIAFAMENPRSRMGIIGNYYIRKNEILDTEKMKNEVNDVKIEDVNTFAKTKYLAENITVLGNINN
nr:insulinase family protein [Leptotrichia hongkongensis]